MTSPSPLPPPAPNHHPLRRVLIGTSLEDESDQVVRSGLAVARAAGAKIHLIHAAPGGPRLVGPETGQGYDFAQELTAWCEERLRGQIERLGIGPSELAGAEILEGVPHQVLIAAAQKAAADLIVVGATGSGPFAAELLGSTADRVLRKATCPVLLVRGELPVPPRRVLAAVDLSKLSGDSFRCGLHLLAQLGTSAETEVRVVYALAFLDTLALKRREKREISDAEAESLSTDELRRFVLENGAGFPLPTATTLLCGDARSEILEELRQRPVDLVMLGTHGRGGLDRLILGSVAATLARKAPCSVLLISPEAALAEDIAEAVVDRTTPAWHLEPAPATHG
ncbi:MAG: universal stress protein [Thermoanaerobaculia bacterium]